MKLVALGLACALVAGGMGVASATPINLIQNGDFSQIIPGKTTPPGTTASVINRTTGQGSPSRVTVVDWLVNNGNPNAAAIWYASAYGALHGPGGPLLAQVTAPPAGSGSFVGLDGDMGGGGNPDIQAGISQQLSGLTIGQYYVVSFYWAASQEIGVSGPTTDRLQVSLGGQTRSTGTLSIASHGFSGWQHASFGFYANSATPWLSFLAIGTPAGLPPISLLTDVSVTVPEPAVLGMFGLGLLGIGVLVCAGRRRAGRRGPAA